MTQPPPLKGVRVLEFAGLAPGPFAGLLCADYGASVLRVDRAHPQAHSSNPPPATPDTFVRHKASITVNTKTAEGVSFLKALLPHVDIVIDPFRPGVLEKMGVGPAEVMQKINPRIIVARMTGFRRDGKYAAMAGHDINYIAVSGALAIFGRKGEKPYPPGNILGDFAGGGAVCFTGILLALMQRVTSGKGQIVEANMVDGSAYLTTMPRFTRHTPMWNSPRGTNPLDGGSPFYGTYETKDGMFMAVGALEPQFYAELLRGLELDIKDFGGEKGRMDKATWPQQKEVFEKKFKSKTRAQWEKVFDGTDACVTPVLTFDELENAGYDQRPYVTLRDSPGLAIHSAASDGRRVHEGQGRGVKGNGWSEKGLSPGVGGEEVLAQWVGWKRGRQYELKEGGLGLKESAKL